MSQLKRVAIITGAAEGIGRGIAKTLDSHGIGVILLGYLPDELDSAAASLRIICPRAAVRTVTMDARTATPGQISTVLIGSMKLRIG